MGLLRLLVLAVLTSERGVAGGGEASGNSKEAILHHISSNVTFLIFQIHSQYQNTTISFYRTLLPNASETGTNRGLVSILRPEQSMCTWYLETLDAEPVHNVTVPLSYSERDPIPGGCNLEFDLGIDPDIYLEYNFFETTIKFAPANLGYARGTDPPLRDVGAGRDSRWKLQYDVYRYFLPENDLTEEVLLKHLQRMVRVSQVKANAVKVVILTADDKTTVSFSSLPGQGVIYNVIVWDPFLNTSAAYVPAHTFACSFKAVDGNCASLGRVSTKVFFTHFALLTPIKYDVHLILTAIAGSVVLGFLISSVTFFTPLGNLKVFRDDGVFWVTFSGIVILIPLVFMGCLRILNILTCGVMGSYSVVLAVDSYLYTSLSHITLNVLRRALNKDFHSTFTNLPFQTNDFITLAVWGMLAVSGITLQIRGERGQPFFSPHPYKLWNQSSLLRARTYYARMAPSHI
uniref:TM7S3/TM198-like domain-containing protein n=1 Tax=Propithecus coquereli TaxID=379532 RepID=A0A2K6GR33_PROCO